MGIYYKRGTWDINGCNRDDCVLNRNDKKLNFSLIENNLEIAGVKLEYADVWSEL